MKAISLNIIIIIMMIIKIIMDYFCIALFFIRKELTALGRVVSFEVCCQWAVLGVPITGLVTLAYCTEVHLSFCQ